jgi:hypothetical protein
MIKLKLYMTVPWMLPYTVGMYYVDQKFKMAATTGLSF